MNHTITSHSFLIWCSPLAVGIIVVCTLILFLGASESATFNLFISVVNVTIIVFIIILGAVYWDKSNWDNFFGPGESWHGFGGVMSGVFLITRD